MTIIHSILNAVIIATVCIPSSTAVDFASNGVHMLEQAYIEDCEADLSPHGYYGAFLQPCEFTFREVDDSTMILHGDSTTNNMCSDETSKVISKPVPMNWFFNLTEHFDKDDWDSISSDDMSELADKLMLWPDQCVGVTTRCYSIEDSTIRDTLSKLFDEIPDGATHVEVNCKNDAMELSRVIYTFADGFEKSIGTIIAWIVTVVLFSLVASLWCCYACVRLLRGPTTTIAAVTATPVPTGDIHYVAIETGDNSEKIKLMKK